MSLRQLEAKKRQDYTAAKKKHGKPEEGGGGSGVGMVSKLREKFTQ